MEMWKRCAATGERRGIEVVGVGGWECGDVRGGEGEGVTCEACMWGEVEGEVDFGRGAPRGGMKRG